MSPGGFAVGTMLMTLMASSPSPEKRFGVIFPLLLRECDDAAPTPGTENVPRDPSGNESVCISKEDRAVVAWPWSGLTSFGRPALSRTGTGRGGSGGSISSWLTLDDPVSSCPIVTVSQGLFSSQPELLEMFTAHQWKVENRWVSRAPPKLLQVGVPRDPLYKDLVQIEEFMDTGRRKQSHGAI